MQTHPVEIDAARTALVMIEFQNEWLAPWGRLNGLVADRDQLGEAIGAASELLDVARRANLTVFHVGLRYQSGHPELGTSDLGLREAIPRVGTFVGEAADFTPPFTPAAGELTVAGRLGASAFAGSNLDAILRNRRIDTLLIAGFALHVCVESTLRHAHDLGYRALVVADATAAFTAEQRAHVLDHVVHHFGAVIGVSTVEAAFKETTLV